MKSCDMFLSWMFDKISIFISIYSQIFEPKENKEDCKLKKEIPKTLITSCQQIVDGLVNSVMVLESQENKRIVGCITALHLFAKIRPQLLVQHALTLESYLNIRCHSANVVKFMSCVAEILEHVRGRHSLGFNTCDIPCVWFVFRSYH
jgi:cohesin loading factor subunit SCC2